MNILNPVKLELVAQARHDRWRASVGISHQQGQHEFSEPQIYEAPGADPLEAMTELADMLARNVAPTMNVAMGYAPQPARANLGLASTKELLRELEARADVGGYGDYRTVDEDAS